ncbi:MAG TPA: hypothetical protein VGH79_02580 [Gaiellaceae bacterium]
MEVSIGPAYPAGCVAISAAPPATGVVPVVNLGEHELGLLLRAAGAPRLAMELGEAALALGVSRKFFAEHIKPELRLVRRGRRVLVPRAELERWLSESAAFTLDRQR